MTLCHIIFLLWQENGVSHLLDRFASDIFSNHSSNDFPTHLRLKLLNRQNGISAARSVV